MNLSELDNPIWFSLRSRHRALAKRVGDAARYPLEVAPFLAVASTDADAAGSIASLLAPVETVYLLGVAPRFPGAWSLHAYARLAQMICTVPIPVVDGPAMIELSEAHRADVLELTALVYPHYFRPRTMDMGRYFGIYEVDKSGYVRLAAMAGERMGWDTHQEISAICTHPAFNGRGYARRLTAMLTNDNLARGRTPFLHASHENHRALRMYEQLGYAYRPDIGFWSLRRST
jgi:ribosomal protein S18 acetylase RimI-like enzyme